MRLWQCSASSNLMIRMCLLPKNMHLLKSFLLRKIAVEPRRTQLSFYSFPITTSSVQFSCLLTELDWAQQENKIWILAPLTWSISPFHITWEKLFLMFSHGQGICPLGLRGYYYTIYSRTGTGFCLWCTEWGILKACNSCFYSVLALLLWYINSDAFSVDSGVINSVCPQVPLQSCGGSWAGSVMNIASAIIFFWPQRCLGHSRAFKNLKKNKPGDNEPNFCYCDGGMCDKPKNFCLRG